MPRTFAANHHQILVTVYILVTLEVENCHHLVNNPPPLKSIQINHDLILFEFRESTSGNVILFFSGKCWTGFYFAKLLLCFCIISTCKIKHVKKHNFRCGILLFFEFRFRKLNLGSYFIQQISQNSPAGFWRGGILFTGEWHSNCTLNALIHGFTARNAGALVLFIHTLSQKCQRYFVLRRLTKPVIMDAICLDCIYYQA